MTTQAQTTVFDLTVLFAPTRPEDFFREHWERKHFHLSRGDTRYYNSLLTNEDLETIISSGDLRYPAIQLARNGSYFPAEAYTKNIKHGGEFFNGVPDLGRIQSEYRSGSTVVLPALQWIWAPLRELCASLENKLNHAVHANAYLTPGDSIGFTPHYDTHDVFVLQIAGKKRWRIFAPPLTLPHRSQPFTPTGYALPAPLLELELQPGDLLYLPRGFVHAASTSDTYSAHVTIGMTVYTWVELASELIASSKDLESFRTALPPGFATREDLKQTLKEGLIQRMDDLRQTSDYDRLIESFLQKVRAGGVRPRGAFQSDVRVIGLQTRLKVPERGRYCVSTESGRAILEFEGRKFALPDQIRTTFDDMCKRTSFRPGELSGPLDNDGKLGLARYLHGECFLTMAD
ncbi:MAG TPA: cupin domain-containing protein [Methylocella sp.]|nr:cupin domain-containing protein [Methylocella sp.]